MENFNEVQEIPDVKETKEEPKTEESENSAKDAKKQQKLNDEKEKEEKNNAELELTYQTALLDLKEAFSKIPEDLTDKSIWITYESGFREERMYLSLDSNWIYLNYTKQYPWEWPTIYFLRKSWESRKAGDWSYTWEWPYTWEEEKENFKIDEFINNFEKYIKKITENSDKCKVNFEN